MKNVLYLTVVLLCCLLLLSSTVSAQTYNKVKIIMKSGVTQEGKKGIITADQITFYQGSIPLSIDLSEVQLIMAKKGLVTKFGLIGCGTCAGVGLIAYAARGDELTSDEKSQYWAGLAIWMVIFGAGGAAIGAIADDWNTVYTAPSQSSIWDRVKFGFATTPRGRYQVGITYHW
jgi:hypothetical protein